MSNEQIILEVKQASAAITTYAEKADVASFLSCYHDSPDFMAFSGDGRMSNYSELKKLCEGYYGALKQQKVIVLKESFHVVEANVVIAGWVVDITATFKNGDVMIMKDYAITNVFKNFDGGWKVIHSHESSLPPEIIKAQGAE